MRCAGVPRLSPQRRREEEGASGAVLVSDSELEQRKGEVGVPVHGSGSGATVRGTLGAVFIGAGPPLPPPPAPPTATKCTPESLHTQRCCLTKFDTASSPPRQTLTPLWSRSRFQTASWQRLGQHGRQHVLHVLLHGPVGVWGGLLGALRSPLAHLALKRTDLAHCPHSPSHPDSLSDPLTRRTKTAFGARRHPARQAIMGVILNSGGAWYLGVKEEDAGTAAASCYIAAAVYGIYMVMCGLRIMKANSKARGRAQIHDEEDH